jgi:hypothetical protein
MKQTVGYTKLITDDGRVLEEIILPPNGYCPVKKRDEDGVSDIVGIASLTFKEMTGDLGPYQAVIADMDIATSYTDLTACLETMGTDDEPCPEGHSHMRVKVLSLFLVDGPNAWGEKNG